MLKGKKKREKNRRLCGTPFIRMADHRRAMESWSIRHKELEEIEKDLEGHGWFISNGVLLRYNGKKTEIQMPSSVVEISGNAFVDAPQVETVYLPRTVQNVGYINANGNSTIKSLVTLPGNKFFHDSDIAYPDGILLSIDRKRLICFPPKHTVPDSGVLKIPSVDIIDPYAFANNEYVRSLRFSEETSTIAPYAFCGSRGLEELVLPRSITTIGNHAFSNCKNLKRVVISGDIEEITEGCFEGCTKLEEVILPESVWYIHPKAFKDCRSLKHVVGSEHIHGIEYDAFRGCSSLESFVLERADCISRGVSQGAFVDCPSLKKIICMWNSVQFANGVFDNPNATLELHVEPKEDKTTSADGEKKEPYRASIPYLPLECKHDEGRELFTKQPYKNVVIHGDLKEIKEDGFYKLDNCEKITIYGNVHLLGTKAFNKCPKLKRIEILGDVLQIEECAFANCDSLEDVIITGNLGTCAKVVFYCCNSIKNVEVYGKSEEVWVKMLSAKGSGYHPAVMVGGREIQFYWNSGAYGDELNGETYTEEGLDLDYDDIEYDELFEEEYDDERNLPF